MILLPLAFILAYLSYTLQYSPTFPYFKHMPLYRKPKLSEQKQQGLLLPLHKPRRKSLPAGRPLFAPDFTISSMSLYKASSSGNSPLYIPPRPSPLRKSFTDGDCLDSDVTCGLRKTSYFSPLAPQLSHVPTSSTSAVAPQLQRQNATNDTTVFASQGLEGVSFTVESPPGPPTRSNCRPKKAKSLDNFRSSLFPLWETDESEDVPATTQPAANLDGKPGRRLLGKKRACSSA